MQSGSLRILADTEAQELKCDLVPVLQKSKEGSSVKRCGALKDCREFNGIFGAPECNNIRVHLVHMLAILLSSPV